MYKSLYTLMKAHRYASAAEARERVEKAYPKYLTPQQRLDLIYLIQDEYGE